MHAIEFGHSKLLLTGCLLPRNLWREYILKEGFHMEDIVAVAVDLENGDVRYFLTWGRIQNTVDPHLLEQVILAQSTRFAIGGKAVRARLCSSLQDAAQEAGFYECFFSMCQKRIPFGEKTYPKWRSEIDGKMRAGKEIYYLWHGP